MSESNTPASFVERWHRGLCTLHMAHFQTARRYQKFHLLFGIPVVILATIVSTAVFATMETSESSWIKAITGALSLASAVLASLQTFLRFGERAEQHKSAAVRYAGLRRELEQKSLSLGDSLLREHDFLVSLRKRWIALDAETPIVPDRVLRRAAAHPVAMPVNEPALNRPRASAEASSSSP